jgi:hypothetical protein
VAVAVLLGRRLFVLARRERHHKRQILVVQRFASRFARGSLALALSSAGCASGGGNSIPRTLDGMTVRGTFVPPTSYEAYVRGELLLAEGRAREAVAQFELATTAPDEDAYLLSRLAFAELMAGDAKAARRTLERAEQLDRCSEAVWLVRGAIAERDDDLVAVRAAYQRAAACAPRSPAGALALARYLQQRGDRALALDVLVHLTDAQRAGSEQELGRSLKDADAATLAHALASLGADRAADSHATEDAVALALERGLPRLAARVAESRAANLPVVLRAELLRALGDRERLAGLIAQHGADELGGSAKAAQLALWAGAFERAELEATSALTLAPSDPLRAIRARAQLALGLRAQALDEARRVTDPALRRALMLEALAAAGAPALASELGRAAAP